MLKGGQPDYETLRGMKYVKNVVNESLRLFPPVPQNARTAVRNTTLPRGGGPESLHPVFVPKGALVRHVIFATHRSKAIYGGVCKSLLFKAVV
jgi:cytochrome P450